MLDAKSGAFNLNRDDEVVAGALLAIGGELVRK
jgi:NAD(P) transhydrogenase subunit alpha